MRLSDRSVRETLHVDLIFVQNDGRTGTRDVTFGSIVTNRDDKNTCT